MLQRSMEAPPPQRGWGRFDSSRAVGRNRASLTRMAQAAALARAWIGTIVFLFLAPGVVAGLIPWLISGWRWHDWGDAAWVVVPIAWIAIAVGAAFLLHAFALFALHRGTPAPVAPTETLVVTGVYRVVRNPMYLAVLAIILGQALLFGNWWLVLYAMIALTAVVAFVKGYEEPTRGGGKRSEWADVGHPPPERHIDTSARAHGRGPRRATIPAKSAWSSGSEEAAMSTVPNTTSSARSKTPPIRRGPNRIAEMI
jgi:protein-S-isoprenylcysteine O-methyltransferase Ste14